MKSLYKNIAIVLFFVFSISLNAQNTITIDNTPQSTSTYKTIQEAIDAANNGDIIFVQPSPTSYGSATINKEVSIVGRSHSEVNNTSAISNITITASNVTISGMYISSISYIYGYPSVISNIKIYDCEINSSFSIGYPSTYYADGIEIRGCIIGGGFNQYISATNVVVSNNIFTGSSVSIAAPSEIIITNNIFRYTSNMSFSNSAAGETAILYNNMFIQNSSANRVVTFTSGDWNISNCLTYNYGSGNYDFTSSGASTTFQVNNSLLNTDPLFTNVDASINTSFASTSTYNSAARPEDDLTLQTGSPALTGGGGTELGVFNNGFNFRYLGNPRGIPTLDIVTYDGAVPKDGSINVTISAKAQ